MARLKMRYIDRLPTISNPNASRGTEMHAQAEGFVNGTISQFPPLLKHFAEELYALRDLYRTGKVTLEAERGFDIKWLPAPYKGAWLRMKDDATVFMSKKWAVVIDYKSGRKDGNEIKHGEQVLLYAICILLQYPELEKVTVELWYLDKDDLTSVVYTRMQALRYLQGFDRRALKLTEATAFPANPSLHTCKWCDYAPHQGGQCPVGVSNAVQPVNFYRNKFKDDWKP